VSRRAQDKVLQPLLASGAIEVVHEDWVEDWKPENAKKSDHMPASTKAGHDFAAILASNDGTAGGAIQALIEEGLAGKVLVTGQDADLAACQRIVSGTQSMTIYKPLKNLADRAAEYAVKLAQRRPVVAAGSYDNGQIQVPTVLLDRDPRDEGQPPRDGDPGRVPQGRGSVPQRALTPCITPAASQEVPGSHRPQGRFL